MPRKNKNRKNKEGAVQASPVFDTALPVDLLYRGVKEEQQKQPRIEINKEINLSPYIIRLTHEGNERKSPALQAAEKLHEELLSLKTEEKIIDENELSFNFDDLVAQVEDGQDIVLDRQEAEEFGVVESDLVTFDSLTAEMEMPEIIDLGDDEEISTLEIQEEDSEPYIRLTLPKFKLPGNFKLRIVASFVGLSLLVAGPLQAMSEYASLQGKTESLENSGQRAVQYLDNASGALQAQDFQLASQEFISADESFADLSRELKKALGGVASIATLIPQTNRTIKSVEGLIEAGSKLSQAAELLSDIAYTVENSPHLYLTDKTRIFGAYAEQIIPLLREAQRELRKVDNAVIPEERREMVDGLRRTVPALLGSFELYTEHVNALNTILGGDVKRRYLLIFQNTAELRATGGFAGSFAEIDIDRGEITAINVPPGGTYDIQGQLQKFVASPPPMHLIKPRWEFQDANWYADFPLSAKQFIRLHEAAGGPTVDGVIALNSTVLPRLLEITGPIELEGYERTFTAENVLFELQKIVEIEFDDLEKVEGRNEDAPKLVIGDLMAEVMERLSESELMDALQIFDLFLEKFNKKEAFVFFANNEIQAVMKKLNWTGAQRAARMDELQIINTNIGGGKTDTVIDQDVDLLVRIKPDGRIVNTLTYTKTHRGLQTALFEGVNNVDYIRFYVPKGSKLISAEGFNKIPPDNLFKKSEIELGDDDIYNLVTNWIGQDEKSKTDIFEENGKTVFGNWMQIRPGEVEQVTLVYELPFILEKPESRVPFLQQVARRFGWRDLHEYELLIQKQSGVQNRKTRVTIDHGEMLSIWRSHENQGIFENDYDHLVQYLLENK